MRPFVPPRKSQSPQMTASLKILIAGTKIKLQPGSQDTEKRRGKARKKFIVAKVKDGRHVKCGNCLIHSNPARQLQLQGPWSAA